jgi:hypothetical protein
VKKRTSAKGRRDSEAASTARQVEKVRARAKVAKAGSQNINEALAALLVPLDSLTLDPENARSHDARNIEAIAFSLREFGQQKPVVTTRGGIVVAGNGMVEAARSLGWKQIAAVQYPSDDVSAVRAFALADNRTAELSRWDDEALSKNLALLKEAGYAGVAALGWNAHELELLIQADWTPREPTEGGLETEKGGKTIKLTHEQFDIIVQACAKLRTNEGDETITDGRCLELICAEYLS